MCVYTYVRMYVCAYVGMCVYTYVRIYVCTYVRMYVYGSNQSTNSCFIQSMVTILPCGVTEFVPEANYELC